MAVKFLSPLANANQFPAPCVSATPHFKLSDMHIADINVFRSSPYNLDKVVFTRNGRGAIGIAGKALKKPGKNVILIPAYHCPALVEPFIWLGYEIRFYPVKDNLHVDQSVLESAIAQGDVSHCVLVRYFGFNQNVEQIAGYLQEQSIEIIEDCAHSMFRFLQHCESPRPAGAQVSASICSINKILPTVDGGALFMAKEINLHVQQTSWMEELKAFAYLMGVPQFLDRLKGNKKTGDASEEEDSTQPAPSDAEQLRYFQPIDIDSASYRHTQFILARSNIKKIREQRRRNFMYLLSKINNPLVGNPLYDKLDDLDVPYVFPFLLHADQHFFALRKKGIQILRWEEVAETDCQVSMTYRSRLIQIPCHHQLTQGQLDFVVDTINQLHP